MLAGLLITLLGGAAQALEIGGLFQTGNLGFAADRLKTDTTFTGSDYFYGGSLFLKHQFADNLSLEGGFTRDLILRNLVYSMLSYRVQYISLGVGPFFGTFNDLHTVLKSGITTSVRLELPGVIFAQLRSDNSMAGRLVETGDYIQEGNDITLGFYVTNAICSLGLITKKFTQKQEAAEVVDSLSEYYFQVDIFQKNLPFRLVFTFSYQSLGKAFYDGTSNPVHTLNSIVLGTEADINLSGFLALVLNLDSSIYSFGQDELLGISNPGPGGFLFRASAGFRLDLSKLKAIRETD
jgi:hypothetical protein